MLALLWVAQACAPVAQTDPFATLSPVYDPALVWRAGHENGLRTVVVGSPFKTNLSDESEKLRPILRLPPWHQRADFTLVPNGASRRGYRLVLVFNPTAPLTFGEACKELDHIETSSSTPTVHLHAAFCTGDRPLSEIDGRGGDLQALLDQTLARLLTPNNRDNFREGRCAGVFRLCL